MATLKQMWNQFNSMTASGREKKVTANRLEVLSAEAQQLEVTINQDHRQFLVNGLGWYENHRSLREFTSRMKKAKLEYGMYDFTVFNDVDPLIMSDLMKNFRVLFYSSYKDVAKSVLEQRFVDQSIALKIISCYSYFDEFRPIVEHTSKHRDYFDSNANLESIMSILNHQYNPDGASAERENRNWIRDVLYGGTRFDAVKKCDLINWYPLRSKHQEAVEGVAYVTESELQPSVESLLDQNALITEDYVNALNIISSADKSIEDFNSLKMALLRAANTESDDEPDVQLYNFIIDAAKVLLGAVITWSDNGETKGGRAFPVDVIIAEATRLSRAGMISEIDTMLSEQIELYVHAEFDSAEQLILLASSFASMEAYKQEQMVLECMVANNLPRTEQLEAMLNFLRNGGAETASTMSSKIELEYTDLDDKLAVDYRVMSWSEKQITALFDLQSGKSELYTTPLVVAEWSKSIPTTSVRWDNTTVMPKIKECIWDNFEDTFAVQAMEVATIMDGDLDYADSILIKPQSYSKYPWIGFVLTGEQLTLKQVSLSIFALYHPADDFLDERSPIKRNQKAANRTTMLKMKQNPRINNYISLVVSLIIDTLEEYFNGSASEDIY